MIGYTFTLIRHLLRLAGKAITFGLDHLPEENFAAAGASSSVQREIENNADINFL